MLFHSQTFLFQTPPLASFDNQIRSNKFVLPQLASIFLSVKAIFICFKESLKLYEYLLKTIHCQNMIFVHSMVRVEGLFFDNFMLSFLKITTFSNFTSSFTTYSYQSAYQENGEMKA